MTGRQKRLIFLLILGIVTFSMYFYKNQALPGMFAGLIIGKVIFDDTRMIK